MRLQVSKTKNAASFYVVQSIYDRKTKKRSNIIVEKLGTYEMLKEQYPDQDPYEWAKKYVETLNEEEKKQKEPSLQMSFSPSEPIAMEKKVRYHGGGLFLEALYHQLKLPALCRQIQKRHRFDYPFDEILCQLILGRILFPSSKLNTYECSKRYLKEPTFSLHHVYRALEVLAKESSFLQAQLYQNSIALSKRNTKILYYDCTNFFFEIEEEEGLKQYGYSKEHRPSPIVQMGLFLDGDGIPLAFRMSPGNQNEQTTLRPLEKQILSDFGLSKFVVCTDAGLSSHDNRLFNSYQDRAFLTTQSVKKLKKEWKEWALAPEGWQLENSRSSYDLTTIREDEQQERVFYKERWITEKGLRQKLIVTYSPKYKAYQRSIRQKQIERALQMLERHPQQYNRKSKNDYKRFIEKTSVTKEGEVAKHSRYRLDEESIQNESSYDGFYAVCTNLEDPAPAIIHLNKKRWEIEDCFRMMKSQFKARPVYLSRNDRIEAHFLTCFLALLLYRLLEKKLGKQYTSDEILHTLREMQFHHLPKRGYLPSYTRTPLTDALHEAFGFRTDYEILTEKQLKKILKIVQS